MNKKRILMAAVVAVVVIIAVVLIIVNNKQKQKTDGQLTAANDNIDSKLPAGTKQDTNVITVIRLPQHEDKVDEPKLNHRSYEVKPEAGQPSAANTEPTLGAASTVDLSPFNGAKYTQLSTNYNLAFTVISKNKLQFSGNMCGYHIGGELTYVDNRNFKVSGSDASGSISFVDGDTKVVGSLTIKSTGLACPVDLIKANE